MVQHLPRVEAPKLLAYGSDYPKYLEHFSIYEKFVLEKKRAYKSSLLEELKRTKKPATSGPVVRDDAARLASRRGKRRAYRLRRRERELKALSEQSKLIAGIVQNNNVISKAQGSPWAIVSRKVRSPSAKGQASKSDEANPVKIISISETRDDRARVQNVDDPWIQWNKRKRLFLAGKENPDGLLTKSSIVEWAAWQKSNPEPERFMVFDTVAGCLVPFINGLDDVK
jgi:hypothetical protein